MVIYGKIFIKKKSGPGEITGVTELELQDINYIGTSSVTFNDIQFTEPGDYIISISSDASEIEPMELSIKVIDEGGIISQSDRSYDSIDEQPITGSRPIITQIDKTSIKLPPIKFKTDGSLDQTEYTDGLGSTPLLWYKAIAINAEKLLSLRLYHDGILPKIKFIFKDTEDLFKGEFAPTDDSTIDLFLSSLSSNLKSIHMNFKIESFKEMSNSSFAVTGVINIPGLFIRNNKKYKGTSFDVLRSVCRELDLGFNSNIKDTNDSMTWLNYNKKPYEFIQDYILPRTYISDESYLSGYIDYYYCFNFVDLEKEYNRDASQDIGIETSLLSSQLIRDESSRLIPLRLSTDEGHRSTSLYVDRIEKINDSTKKSLQEGYSTMTKYYDRESKSFLVFKVDSTTSDGSKSIILKGSKGDSKFQDDNVKHKFLGKLDKDNAHENYQYSLTQNRINLVNLNKVIINAILPNANWNIYKYMKIYLSIINKVSTPANPGMIDYRYSGYYIVSDVEYIWDGKNLSQKLRLISKELGKSNEEIINDPPMSSKDDSKSLNDNPTNYESEDNIPNSIYNIGESYIVEDSNGNKYEINITGILANGNEVTGTLKSI